MVTTVSEIERSLLRNAQKNGEVSRPEVLAELYGWPLHGDAYSHHRFDPAEIGHAEYNRGNASVNMCVRRLRDKGLLRGDALTAEGYALLAKLE